MSTFLVPSLSIVVIVSFGVLQCVTVCHCLPLPPLSRSPPGDDDYRDEPRGGSRSKDGPPPDSDDRPLPGAHQGERHTFGRGKASLESWSIRKASCFCLGQNSSHSFVCEQAVLPPGLACPYAALVCSALCLSPLHGTTRAAPRSAPPRVGVTTMTTELLLEFPCQMELIEEARQRLYCTVVLRAPTVGCWVGSVGYSTLNHCTLV